MTKGGGPGTGKTQFGYVSILVLGGNVANCLYGFVVNRIHACLAAQYMANKSGKASSAVFIGTSSVSIAMSSWC